MFEKRQVHMLPTKEVASKGLFLFGNQLGISKNEEGFKPRGELTKGQHLYFTSNEESKEGDWVIIEGINPIVGKYLGYSVDKTHDVKVVDGSIFPFINKEHFRKIIATTDMSIYINPGPLSIRKSYPAPSKAFINVFMKEYNKGNIITEVLVEYGYKINKSLGHFHQFREYFLKVNSKDNTITIKKLVESIDDKIFELYRLGSHLFIEDYSHTNQPMYKYLNPYTSYKENKIVLHPIADGIEKSLDTAIADIKKRKEKY